MAQPPRSEPTRRACAIFDMDGTLAHFDVEHLGPLVHGETKSWDAFHDAMAEARPIEPVAKMLRMLKAAGETIVICSGRPEEWSHRSEAWLHANDLPFDAIYLRPKGADHVSDPDVKRALLARMRADGFEPWIVFEDRATVVDAWRAEGLICLQCAPGDF